MRRIVVLVFLLVFFSFSGPEILAYDFLPQKVYPNRVFEYNLKRFKEKAGLAMTPSKRGKLGYQMKLLEVRLSELDWAVEGGGTAYIEKVSQRYAATAGQITELSLSSRFGNEKEAVRELFMKHLEVISSLARELDTTTAQWRFVMNDYNSLKEYLGKI